MFTGYLYKACKRDSQEISIASLQQGSSHNSQDEYFQIIMLYRHGTISHEFCGVLPVLVNFVGLHRFTSNLQQHDHTKYHKLC